MRLRSARRLKRSAGRRSVLSPCSGDSIGPALAVACRRFNGSAGVIGSAGGASRDTPGRRGGGTERRKQFGGGTYLQCGQGWASSGHGTRLHADRVMDDGGRRLLILLSAISRPNRLMSFLPVLSDSALAGPRRCHFWSLSLFQRPQLNRAPAPSTRASTVPPGSNRLPTTETSFITRTEVSACKPIAQAIHPVPPGIGTQTSAGVIPPAAEPLAKWASLHYEYSLWLPTIPPPLLGTWSVLRLDSGQTR